MESVKMRRFEVIIPLQCYQRRPECHRVRYRGVNIIQRKPRFIGSFEASIYFADQDEPRVVFHLTLHRGKGYRQVQFAQQITSSGITFESGIFLDTDNRFVANFDIKKAHWRFIVLLPEASDLILFHPRAFPIHVPLVEL